MPRLVKRYGNRKLYDTSESRYVTLDEIGRWVKAGEDVRILENDTGEDLTAVTFAQIILEEERRKSGLLPLRVLRELIQHGERAGGAARAGAGAARPAQPAARGSAAPARRGDPSRRGARDLAPGLPGGDAADRAHRARPRGAHRPAARE